MLVAVKRALAYKEGSAIRALADRISEANMEAQAVFHIRRRNPVLALDLRQSVPLAGILARNAA